MASSAPEFEDVGLDEHARRANGSQASEGATTDIPLDTPESSAKATEGAEAGQPSEEPAAEGGGAGEGASGEVGSSSDAPIVGGSIVGDVLYSIATGEEEGKSRARILAFAAKRYQTAVEKNPKDYDALYNWALVLQESADNCGPDAGLHGKDALLEDACNKYQAATGLCSTLHEAFYNWAIAISDRAKIRGRTAEAEDLWKQACDKYEKAVQLNWDSPQALNNWGLALQELANIVPAKEKRAVIRKAINKFRAAIRLRFDFHRAIYNLGTVLYGLAEDTAKAEKKGTAAPQQHHQEIYSQSAVYIASAHSLKADYPVYRNALRLVRTMLPLPYLKGGYLTVPPNGNSFAAHTDWRRRWFVLDHDWLREGKKPEPKPSTLMARRASSTAQSQVSAAASITFPDPATSDKGGAPAPAPAPGSGATLAVGEEGEQFPLVAMEISTILSVDAIADLSLPRGGGIVLGTPSGPFYMVADDWDAMDSWVDAIRLVYTIYVRAKSEDLAAVLAG